MPEPRPGFALLEELPEALAAVTADRGSGFFAGTPLPRYTPSMIAFLLMAMFTAWRTRTSSNGFLSTL